MLHHSQLETMVWVLGLVQLAGLLTAAAARLHQGRPAQNLWHGLFIVCLGLSGLSTLAALMIGPGSCTICGAVMAVSVLTAVWEVRGTHAHAL